MVRKSRNLQLMMKVVEPDSFLSRHKDQLMVFYTVDRLLSRLSMYSFAITRTVSIVHRITKEKENQLEEDHA